MFFSKKAPVTWLVVGLGNPGSQYDNTRHNAGFMAVDALAAQEGFSVQKVKFHALTGQVTLGDQGVLVLKPTTYMNLSGDAVSQAASFYKVPPERVIILCDDTALPVGKLRIRTSGSAGGHNGLKDLIAKLGTDKFVRVRIGVGSKPHPDYDMADWVLGKFSAQDAKAMEEACKRAAQAACAVITQGTQKAMNQFN